MLMHTLKIIWNRKGDNALIIIELMLAFLVVFFIAAIGIYHYNLYRQPLGFEWQDTVELRFFTGGEWTEDDGKTLSQVLQVVRDQPDVEWAHLVNMPPFRGSRWTGPTTHGGIEVRTMFNEMSDGAPEDFGVELLDGRWFNAGDSASEEFVVLINERLRDELFGDESPLGADIRKPPESVDPEDVRAYRVIGVFRDFRQWGELRHLTAYAIGRFEIEDMTKRASTIQLRLRPDTPVDFEQTLQNTVQAVAPSWRFTLTPLEKLREQRIRDFLIPMTLAALIAGFLLLMVAFGLFGVLWQNVTRRTDELGLRRAVGASRRRIYRQIVTETGVLAALAATVGLALAVQVPMVGSFQTLNWHSSSLGIGVSVALIVGLATLCSLYPAWLAARRSPAEALHYE